MRVLFLSPRQCWPTLSGAKLRDYYFAKALGERAQLTYFFFAERGAPAMTREQMPFAEKLAAISAPHTYTPGKIVRGLLGRWPLPVVNYTTIEMKRAVSELVAGTSFDFVHLDVIQMAAYEQLIVRLQPNARIIYNWHNIESELMRRYAASAPSLPRRIYGRLTARSLEALERRLLSGSFGHLVCSEREKERLLQIVPSARIAVIENGVDTAAFSPKALTGAERKRLVFVGSMNYHANIEAAVWFTRHVWPAVHRQFPDWSLTLVGSNPAPAVLELAGDAVEVTGTVPSVAPYYNDAFAAIVPLRTGGGTRLKILEAMAAKVPVISTTLGAEGLAVSAGQNILIADSESSWMEAFAALSASEERWNAVASAGRSLVESRYDWQVLGRTLYETYREWLDSA